MSKRRPDSQLTQSNWDDEVEHDEAGHFKKADAKEMETRNIIQPRRRLIKPSEPTESSEPVEKAPSVFSGFSLLSKSPSIGVDTSKPSFSFASKTGTNTFGTLSGAPALTSSVKSISDSKNNQSNTPFETKLKELNKSVFDCIKSHIESGKICILSPIFKDYDKYVAEIKSENEKNTTTNVEIKKTENLPTPQFSFGGFKPAASTDNSTPNVASAVMASPNKASIATPLFSFGKTAPALGVQSSGFSFSTAIQQATQSNNNKNEEGANGTNADDADENDEPPKVEFVPVVEENFYSKRCKIFVKDDGDYKERGTGTLYLKNVTDDKVQLLVRADTSLGNILLNILLSSGIPAKRIKNNIAMVCLTPDSDKKPKSVLVRVKTENDAIELLEEIQKYQK